MIKYLINKYKLNKARLELSKVIEYWHEDLIDFKYLENLTLTHPLRQEWKKAQELINTICEIEYPKKES